MASNTRVSKRHKTVVPKIGVRAEVLGGTQIGYLSKNLERTKAMKPSEQRFADMEASVIYTYNTHGPNDLRLTPIMESHRGHHLDFGGWQSLHTEDDKHVLRVIIEVFLGPYPEITTFVRDGLEKDPDSDPESEAEKFYEMESKLFETITKERFGWK